MADGKRNVKVETPNGNAGSKARRCYDRIWSACIGWFDLHPRIGWYLAGLGVLNVVLNLLQIVLELLR